MPKFFFHVTDGSNRYPDRQGVIFHDLTEAKDYAVAVADDLRRFGESQHLDLYVDVRDADDTQLARVFVSTRH